MTGMISSGSVSVEVPMGIISNGSVSVDVDVPAVLEMLGIIP